MITKRAIVKYHKSFDEDTSILLATFDIDELFVCGQIYFKQYDDEVDWELMDVLVEGMFKEYTACEDDDDVRRWAKKFCNEIKVEVLDMENYNFIPAAQAKEIVSKSIKEQDLKNNARVRNIVAKAIHEAIEYNKYIAIVNDMTAEVLKELIELGYIVETRRQAEFARGAAKSEYAIYWEEV